MGQPSPDSTSSPPTSPGLRTKSDKEALLLGGDSSSRGNVPANLKIPKDRSNHSRQSSYTSSTLSNDGIRTLANGDLADCHQGVIVCLHRKMIPQEDYFLSTEKYRPMLFGLPIIIACSETTTYQALYRSVWTQVSRLVSPLPPRDTSQNHATDCDDSLRYEYPFVLKVIQKCGSWCAWCPWHRFCRGCVLPCTEKSFSFSASNLAIDWDQTALHLRYLSAQEKAYVEDESVKVSLKAATEPITLLKCLETFTKQEELGEDEKYHCSNCKGLQLASKKLQIWKLPPVLIVHLKRFHNLNGRWIKSHKNVDFACQKFDPTDFLAAIPCNTIQRYKELAAMGKSSSIRATKARNVQLNCNGTIDEEVSPEQVELESVKEEVFDSESFDSNVPNHTQKEKVYQSSMRRMRQESTSLYTHPITDDDLQDFHQHRLLPGYHPLDIKYNMYSMVVSFFFFFLILKVDEPLQRKTMLFSPFYSATLECWVADITSPMAKCPMTSGGV